MRIKFYLKRPILSDEAIKRRKYIIELYDKKTPIKDILSISGHKDEKSLLRFIAESRAEITPNKKGPTAIYALANYNGNTLKIYTDEKIDPKFWNPETNYARNTPRFTEHPEFNERLNQIRSAINRVYLDYKNTNDNATPSPAILKPLIEIALKRHGQKTTFLDYFEDFVDRSISGKRIDPRGKMPVKLSAAKGYRTTLNHLKEFDKISKRKIDFDNIDLEFHNDFTQYLSSAPRLLSANSIGMNFQRIKAVLAEATERGYNSNLTFKSKYFSKQSEDVDAVYLNTVELMEMQKLNLSNNPRLDRVRDLFLVGAHTGLRISDLSVLKPSDIKDGFIKITPTKTGKPVIIPVHQVVKDILKKYKSELPKSISVQKFNSFLKEIGKLMPSLSKTETKTITKGGKKITKNVEKWKLLTSHSARRSFATNEFKAGTPSITIMAITGHKTEKSFLKYIRVTPDEHAQRIKELWDKRTSKSKLKAV
jgi:integrase